MNFKKSTIIFLLVFATERIFANGAILDNPHLNKLFTKLEIMERDAWQSLQNIGITKDEVYKKLNTFDFSETINEYNRYCHEPLPSSIAKNHIRYVSNLFNIDSSTILLKTSCFTDLASTFAQFIKINEINFNTFSSSAQKYIMAHEIQHMIHLDGYIYCVIRKMMSEKQIEINENDVHSPFNQLSRFCEMRSDIFAAIKNEELACGYVEACNQLLKMTLYNPGTSHPKLEERLALAQQITQLHKTAPTLA